MAFVPVYVQDYDESILKHLTDLRVKTSLEEPVVSVELFVKAYILC